MEIKDSILMIREKIESACRSCGRSPEDVTLIAVSKTQPAPAINEAVAAGIKDIGESYVQEFLDKKSSVKDQGINWHFIGRLQSNKVKYLKGQVAFIHSVCKESVLSEIEKRIGSEVKFFLEINAGEEGSKGGINPGELGPFMDTVLNKHSIRPEGLMCIPPFNEDPAKYFAMLRKLMLSTNASHGLNMKYLSMGMSSDFEIAIREGATHIRVGSLIFGERK